VFKYRPGNW